MFKRSLCIPLLLAITTSTIFSEVTISGPIDDVKKQATQSGHKVVTLSATDHIKLAPQKHLISGVVYARADTFSTVSSSAQTTLDKIQRGLAGIEGIVFKTANAYALTQELAFAELKELEYEIGFEIETAQASSVQAVLTVLSRERGVIVRSLETLALPTESQIEELKTSVLKKLQAKRSLLESNLMIKLSALSVSDFVYSRDEIDGTELENIIELSPFLVNSSRSSPKRKFGQRQTGSAVSQLISESSFHVLITATFEVLPAPEADED